MYSIARTASKELRTRGTAGLTQLVRRGRNNLTVGLGEDLVSRLDPGKGTTVIIPGFKEGVDSGHQTAKATKDAASKGLTVEEREPGFDLVHPTGDGGCEGRKE